MITILYSFAAKSGCKPEEASRLVKHIKENCPHLKVLGLMTIGVYDNYNPVEGINPDFKSLLNCREQVCKEINVDVKDFEVSMGMSADYEHAVSFNFTYIFLFFHFFFVFLFY